MIYKKKKKRERGREWELRGGREKKQTRKKTKTAISRGADKWGQNNSQYSAEG